MFPAPRIGHASGVPPALRRPLVAVTVYLTVLTALAIIGIGIASVIANSGVFGIGVAAVLVLYGTAMLAFAWFTAQGRGWALGLIVASSLLHLFVVGSFLTTEDRAQFTGTLIVAPFVLATLVTAVLAVGRGELDKR